MNYKLLMETAIKVGEVMLSHGAEAHRVEDTVYRILKKANLQTTEVFVIMTGLFATLADPSIETITITKRVRSKGNNLNQICFANQISRQFCDDLITLEEAYERFHKGCGWEYSHRMSLVGNMMIVTTFPLLVDGTLLDCVIALLASVVVAGSIYGAEKIKMHPFLKDLGVAFLAGVTYMILNRMLPITVNQDAIIIACIMPLVPGVAITNAIRDTLNGDYVSGAARAVEAFIKALAIALGVGLSLMMLGGNLVW